MERALAELDLLVNHALPKFNWGASALDAAAISILNTSPTRCRNALITLLMRANREQPTLASSPSQPAERIAYEFEGTTGGRSLGYLAPAAVEFGHNIARYRVLRADPWIAAAPALGEGERLSFIWYLLKKWGREAGWLLLFPFMLAVYPFIKILLWFVDEYEEFKDQR